MKTTASESERTQRLRGCLARLGRLGSALSLPARRRTRRILDHGVLFERPRRRAHIDRSQSRL